MEDADFQLILRILNTNVKGTDKVMYAMTKIKGIGRRFSNLILKKADIDLNKRAGRADGGGDREPQDHHRLSAAVLRAAVVPQQPEGPQGREVQSDGQQPAGHQAEGQLREDEENEAAQGVEALLEPQGEGAAHQDDGEEREDGGGEGLRGMRGKGEGVWCWVGSFAVRWLLC